MRSHGLHRSVRHVSVVSAAAGASRHRRNARSSRTFWASASQSSSRTETHGSQPDKRSSRGCRPGRIRTEPSPPRHVDEVGHSKMHHRSARGKWEAPGDLDMQGRTYLSLRELSGVCPLSYDSLRHLVAEGRLPGLRRLGRRVFVCWEEFDAACRDAATIPKGQGPDCGEMELRKGE